MLTIKVDKCGKEVDRIKACGTREDILTELSAIIAAISREMAQDLGRGKELIDLTILGTVTAGVRYGVNMAADDLTQAPLACDQVTGDQSAAAAAPVPASVLAAVAERIKAVEAKIEVAAAGIALKQRELGEMVAELETLKKWKEGQAC